MKKGFTLIELLAVIVILAIIALIATPIVLNIIEESRDNSNLRSAEMYLDTVEMSIATSTLNNKKIKDGTYNILENGNICLEYTDDKCTNELKVEVDGQTPTAGSTITISNGKITATSLLLNNKTVVKNDKGELIYIPTPKSFAEDDWETIALNVKAGNLSAYKVGNTKEITLTGFTNEEKDANGNNMVTYTIRIANTSNPEECNTAGFSQTACGFVIEFVDIILSSGDNAKMNLTNTNVGGWKDSAMRKYVNDTIYNALPKELKDKIVDTTVVSGHGLNDAPNKVTTDKIYLLSTKEVWEQGTSNTIENDAARELKRQLDYYKNYKNTDGSIGVTTDNYSGAIKNYNGSASRWWLRSAGSSATYIFYCVITNGDWHYINANITLGVAVAFRLG